MLINDRLSTILTQYAGEMAFVQRSQCVLVGGAYFIERRTGDFMVGLC